MSDEPHGAEPADDGLGDITPTSGPWNVSDAPQGTEFYDFGALKLPAMPGLKARLKIDPNVGEIGAVTVRIADGALQLQVIAKQRGVSQWMDTRQALLANLRKRPGHQQVVEGRYGAEVIGVLTGRTKKGMLVDATMRFQGVEGDTWMIRAVSSGASVTHDDMVAKVDAFLSHCAVDPEALAGAAPGTVIPLTDPPGGMDLERAASLESDAPDAGDDE